MADLIKSPERPHVYIVVDGKRRWIPNEHTLFYLGFSFAHVRTITQSEVNGIPEGEPIPVFPDADVIAFAIPTEWPSPSVPVPRDHTFVIARDGSRWGCFGRNDPTAFGARIIAAGNCSIAKAKCLAQGGNGGLVQGVTGACHQAANRILYPSGATVHRANGYAASVAAYGPYGNVSAEWETLKIRCGVLGIPTPPVPIPIPPLPIPIPIPPIPIPPIPIPRPRWPFRVTRGIGPAESVEDMANRERDYVAATHRFGTIESSSDDTTIGEAFRQSVLIRVGPDTDLDVSGICSLQSRLRARHRELLEKLGRNELSNQTYAAAWRETLTRYFSEMKDVCGSERFADIFDGLEPEALAIVASSVSGTVA